MDTFTGVPTCDDEDLESLLITELLRMIVE